MKFALVFLLAIALAVVLPTGLLGQTKTSVFNTDHDVGNAGCASCHVPHTAQANAGRGQTLLWARQFSTTVFGTYDSPTMDETPQEIGDATYSDTNPPTGAKIYSVLCMSCHDGVTATTVIGPTENAAIGNPTNSAGLTDDHPVNMVYSTSDPGLESPTTAEGNGVVLYDDGANSTVQCASCHNVHDNSINKFLRVANSNSKQGLCGACHL